MTIKLEWNTGRLWLGSLPLAQIRHTRKWGWQWTIYGEWKTAPDARSEESAKATCRALVVTLLRGAGVEAEP